MSSRSSNKYFASFARDERKESFSFRVRYVGFKLEVESVKKSSIAPNWSKFLQLFFSSDIWGYHSGAAGDSGAMQRYVVGERFPTFQRIVKFSFSESNTNHNPSKRPEASAQW